MPSVILAGTTSGTALNLTGDTSGDLQFQTNNGSTTAMTLTTAGNVGIGTASPTFAAGGGLNVANSTFATMRARGGSSTGTDFASGNDGKGYVYVRDNADLIVGTNNTERMRITSGGDVGIGCTPSAVGSYRVLELNNTTGGILYMQANGSRVLQLYGAASEGGLFQMGSAALTFGTANTERMRITSGGNLLINTSANSSDRVQIYDNNAAYYALYLNSSSNTGTQYYINFLRQGTQAGYLTSNSATTVQLNNASDVRLKENIKDASSAIPSIMAAKVRQFDWKGNISPHQDFGFVAQELVSVIPEAVTVGKDNEDGTIKMPWGIDYSHIVPRLVKAIQEQQAMIETLQAEVAALKGVN